MSHRARRTDHALLRQLVGEEGDWETFVATYHPRVEKIAAAKVRDHDAAQDIAQDVMMKLVRRLRRGWRNDPQKGGFQALLNVIINHCVADHYRAKQRQLRGGGELPSAERLEALQEKFLNVRDGAGPPRRDEADLAGEVSEDRWILEQGLEQLSESDRRVLTYDGRGSELAREQNRKAGAVRAQKHRAMKRLREALRQRMVRWQTELRPSLASPRAVEHLSWAGQLVLDQASGSGQGPALLFRLAITGRPVAVIRLDACTEIGRGTFADLDPPLFDPEVSGRHCRIERHDEDAWLLEDLGSRNGTTVNDKLLQSAEAVALVDGDRLQIGRQLLVFSAGDVASEEVR